MTECPCCHRIERVRGDVLEVVVPGGARRPAGAPERAAWETLAKAVRGLGPPVVGRCAACGQPMVGDGTPVGWEIPVPGGAISLHPDGHLTGPRGAITVEEADRLVAETYAEPPPGVAERLVGLFQVGLFAALLVPALLAVFMVVYVFWYLANVGARP